MSNKNYFQWLIALFAITFFLVCIGGVYNILLSDPSTQDTHSAEGKINPDSITIKIKSKIPGIICVVLGIVGLTLLIIKIPVKRVVDLMEMETGTDDTYDNPYIGCEVKKIPILMYWLFKRKLKLERE